MIKFDDSLSNVFRTSILTKIEIGALTDCCIDAMVDLNAIPML